MISRVSKLAVATLFALNLSTTILADDDRYIIQLESSQMGLVTALAKRSGGQINLQSNHFIAVTFNGKSLQQVQALMKSPLVKNVEADLRRYPLAMYNDDVGDPASQQLTPYAVYQSQSNQLTLQSGQKVCVIDSGIAGADGETGGKNDDFNWGSFPYDSGSITGDSDSGTGDWYRDGGPHGTHVAGIVTAANNGFGVIGMAPGVPIHIIKVFNASGWAYSSDLAYATTKCSTAGANIITMSLGGGGENDTEKTAFNDFTASGGLVLAAAGNDGNSARSYPAGYKSVMMVGANDADNNIASFSQFPSTTKVTGRGRFKTKETDDGFGVEVTAGGVGVLSTYSAGAATLSLVTVDASGVASAAMENMGSVSGSTFYMGLGDSQDSGANGKICTIDRGEISFQEKVSNCENSGGIGAIIINNQPGMLYGTLGTSNNTTIPAVGTAQEDRTVILAATSASINIAVSNYGYMSGTSMSTPAVAGVAALVWSNHPNCIGADVRAALKAAAEDQGEAGRDDKFGYGIVKAKATSDYLAGQPCGTPIDGNLPPTASFASNCTLLACDFDASGSSDDGSIANYSWDFGDGFSDDINSSNTYQHTYASTGSYTVSLTVTDNEGATNTSSQTVSVTDGTEPPAADITLTGTRSSNLRSVTLNWSGASGNNVDVYVNGNFNNTTANDGSITYRVNKKASYTFVICQEGSTTACSNEIML